MACSGAMAGSTALVQLGARDLTPEEQGLTPYSGGGAEVGESVERKLERLRQDRQAHSRKQIWTKDAHGGPYRKASGNGQWGAGRRCPAAACLGCVARQPSLLLTTLLQSRGHRCR